MEQTVIHFGAGALGKGLVIPSLHESGCSVIAVDIDKVMVEYLQQEKAYTMYVLDDSNQPVRRIPVREAWHLIDDEEAVLQCLKEVDIVTTSVRRENLDAVARLICKGWGSLDCSKKLVICCENVEHVSEYFKQSLAKFCTADIKANIASIIIPDTVVDRGCSRNPSDPFSVLTEQYHEIGVDKECIADTGISQIPAMVNLRQCFYRKRFLVNTYADLFSYFAIAQGLKTFGEAVHSHQLQKYLAPYMNGIIRQVLITEFGMTPEEYDKWYTFYSTRMLRADAKSDTRPLNTIARNMWTKLHYEERIFYPIALLAKRGCDVSTGIYLLADMARIEQERDGLPFAQLCDKLESLWCLDDIGRSIYNHVLQILQE